MKLTPCAFNAVCAIAGLVSWSAAAQAQSTFLVELPAAGYAINSAGQVALATGIYSDGTVTPLPSLPGSSVPAVPLAINDVGQVAGEAQTSTGIYHAILYSNGTLTDLSAGGNITGAYATGINSSGVVVGWSTCPSSLPGGCEPYPVTTGFIYSNGTTTGLSDLPSGDVDDYIYDQPYGINDSGLVTGSGAAGPTNPGGIENDAYIYNIDNSTWNDLGKGVGYAINASGQVTGALTTASVNGAFLYTNGTALNLGTPPGGSNSTGLAINATAHIVGSYLTSGGTIDHAFFYNGVMIDLNTVISAADPLQPYVTLTYAVGINDSGLILVNGTDSRTGNVIHGYLIQAPGIDIAPGTLSLPDTAVGTASATQSVTLTNHGASAVALGAISVSGNFSQTNNCGSSLAPGSNCAVKVAFDPVSVGSKAGQLAIASGGASYVVALYGVAPITASITASATTLAVGQRLTLTWKASAGATCTASSSNPAFQGSVALSGSKALTETAAGTDYYGLHCTATGVPEVDPVTPAVVWTWPTVTTTVAASPTTIVMGQSTTLTWSAANATTCSASGGGANDGWAGTKATHGTQTVTEAYALATASVSLAFTITCSSSASGLSSMATAHVMENAQAAASSGKSGGGGSLDVLCLLVLSSVIVIRIMRSR